jgi:hypothetical protein
MAIAFAVSAPGVARSLAEGLVLDARHPVAPVCPPEAPDEAREAAAWFHSRMRTALEAFLGRTPGGGIAPDVPPRAAEHDARSYCPRCRSQYRVPDGSCTDCGGLALVPLDKTVAV